MINEHYGCLVFFVGAVSSVRMVTRSTIAPGELAFGVLRPSTKVATSCNNDETPIFIPYSSMNGDASQRHQSTPTFLAVVCPG